jgi:putative hydrolase of the HAD superfamily
MAQNWNGQQPEVILLDAVGTLFGVRGSVGEVYSNVACQFGVDVPAPVLNQAFLQSFKNAGAPAFPGTDPSELEAKEFTWWLTIATQTFKQAGALQQFSDFAAFFTELYAHFATAEPWILYSDVCPALQRLQDSGIALGILSNFDSRLYSVLQALNLAHFFSSITISTEVGVAKPQPEIFAIALQKYRCPPERVWHIGDSFKEDYQAAQAAGLRGIWLKRTPQG